MNATFLTSAIAVISLAASTAAVAVEGAKLFGDPDRGQAVADRWCFGCHSFGAKVVDDRIPTIQALARNMTRSEGAIRAFLMQPHEPMPPLELSSQQIEDIVAFLNTVPAKGGR